VVLAAFELRSQAVARAALELALPVPMLFGRAPRPVARAPGRDLARPRLGGPGDAVEELLQETLALAEVRARKALHRFGPLRHARTRRRECARQVRRAERALKLPLGLHRLVDQRRFLIPAQERIGDALDLRGLDPASVRR
jgi:hypothetical protein